MQSKQHTENYRDYYAQWCSNLRHVKAMKTNTMVDTKWKLQSLIIKILSMSPSTIRRGARGSTTVWRNSSTTRTDKVVYKWQHDLFVNRFPLIKKSPDVGLFTHVFSFACFPMAFWFICFNNYRKVKERVIQEFNYFCNLLNK